MLWRARFKVALIWSLVGWIVAILLSFRLAERSFWEAITWYYAWRAPGVAFVLGFLFSPMFQQYSPSEEGVRSRRSRFKRLLWQGVRTVVPALLLSSFGLFLVLFIWPNDMQNSRFDAWKWCGFYWYHHSLLLGSAAVVGGILSSRGQD